MGYNITQTELSRNRDINQMFPKILQDLTFFHNLTEALPNFALPFFFMHTYSFLSWQNVGLPTI